MYTYNSYLRTTYGDVTDDSIGLIFARVLIWLLKANLSKYKGAVERKPQSLRNIFSGIKNLTDELPPTQKSASAHQLLPKIVITSPQSNKLNEEKDEDKEPTSSSFIIENDNNNTSFDKGNNETIATNATIATYWTPNDVINTPTYDGDEEEDGPDDLGGYVDTLQPRKKVKRV